ncbi:TetR/AcrR family transcriptional regulator [Radiobacillus sp. PE A8.2]|uniref:TetR/AcrR family transcriptional regulator n=1 Tax=Radiobacillus sp. PE A8.2 TaxID=3380349 RepID=UPI00389027D7
MSTRDQIIEAAAKLFAEHGYRGMTMKEIASEVGIKAPSVYAFFKNKDEVFTSIYQEALEGHLSAVEMQLQKSKTVKEQLYTILKAAVNFQFQEEIKSKILIRLIISPPDFLKDDIAKRFEVLEKREYDLLYQLFEYGMENGEIKKVDSNELSIAFQCLMDGIFWEMQRYNEQQIYERLEILFKQFWNGISV